MFSFERVNKAGAKFDWAKLDWLNSQYLHKMPAAELTDWFLIGRELNEFDPVTSRLAGTGGKSNGPSLTRLQDAVEMSQLFFYSVSGIQGGATQLKQKELPQLSKVFSRL